MKKVTLIAVFLGMLITLGGCASRRDYGAREDRVRSSPGGCCPGH
jgi:hypothetical protein